MKYKYCPSCKKAYVKSRLEKDTCMYCNGPATTVDVKRNRLYYFGYAIMILGATSAFIPRFTEVSGPTFFFVMGIALAFEILDTSVRTAQDVVRHTDLAVLGAVPDIDDEEVAIERVETAAASTPTSMVAEAFRQIRTNLQFSLPPDRQRTLLVTSPQPEDGKTTVAKGSLAGVFVSIPLSMAICLYSLPKPKKPALLRMIKPQAKSSGHLKHCPVG